MEENMEKQRLVILLSLLLLIAFSCIRRESGVLPTSPTPTPPAELGPNTIGHG
jgi:hypothetical protein